MDKDSESNFDRCTIGGWPETILAASGIEPPALSPAVGVTDEQVEAACRAAHGRLWETHPGWYRWREEQRADMRRVLEQFAAAALEKDKANG